MLENQMTNENSPKTMLRIVLCVVLLLTILPVAEGFSQEVLEPVELTEADWTKFATVEVMTSIMVAKKTKELKSWVRNKEGLGGGARFNEIESYQALKSASPITIPRFMVMLPNFGWPGILRT